MFWQAPNQQVHLALTQRLELAQRGLSMHDVQPHFRVVAQEPLDERRDEPCGHNVGATNAQVPGTRIRQVLDPLQPVPQLVEQAALQLSSAWP